MADPASMTPGEAEVADRRSWIWHALFAASVGIPTGLAAADVSASLGTRTATVAVAVVWAAAYLAVVRRHDELDALAGDRASATYFAVALVLAAVLVLRHPAYFLLVYTLYPQAFLFLNRWRWMGVGLVTAVLALGVVPRAADAPGAAASAVASGALAVVIGIFIEGVHGQSRRRRQALDELSRLHAATEAVAGARTPGAVCAALAAHLGREGDAVEIVRGALLRDAAVVVPLGSTLDETLVLVTGREVEPGEEARWQAMGPHVGVVLDNLRLAQRARAAGVFEERERLAREVHDTLAQALTSIVTQLEAAEAALPGDPDAVGRRLVTARQAARHGLGAARDFIRDGRPAELSDGLVDALGRLVSRWSEEASISARLETGGEVRPLSPEQEAALLRVAQGALANVGQHAAGRRVLLTLTYQADHVRLDVADDGAGFDPLEATRIRPDGSGFGLRSMRDRIEALDGHLTVASRRGEGTTVSAVLPSGRS